MSNDLELIGIILMSNAPLIFAGILSVVFAVYIYFSYNE
jgi:hypothetical protein